MRVAVIGLGSMGMGAAVSLHRASMDITGVDLNPVAIQKFESLGGQTSALDALANIDVCLIYVINAKQVAGLLSPNSPLWDAMNPDGLIISCVTMEPAQAESFDQQVQARGLQFLDAPVSGGSIKAMAGEISIMASGADHTFEKAQPVLSAISAKVFRLGTRAGAGSKMKLVNQHLAGVHIAAACEALVLAAKLDMDLDQVIDVISQCAGTSWMFENRGPHVAAGDYTPHSTVDIFVKDMGIVDSAAGDNQLNLPIAKLAKSLYEQASESGLGQQDDSALAKWLAQQNSVTLPGDHT